MEDTIQLFFFSCDISSLRTLKCYHHHHHHHHLHFNSRRQSLRNLSCKTSSSSSSSISLPPKPFKTPTLQQLPQIDPPPLNGPNLSEKILYLESMGIDFFSLIHDYPSLASSSSLQDIKSLVDYLTSTLGFSSLEFRRICGMCPEILNCKVSDIAPVFAFLLREVNVKGNTHMRKVINRRPRLLLCHVTTQLRPTLYFLQSLGISEVHKHTYLLSCSVEDKLLPRIHYLEKIGFSYRDAVSMVRRFPQLFCYGIQSSFKPKFDYFVREMRRDLKELNEFPQYFSFSLENRIKPRHLSCVAKGVCFPLPVMLKTRDAHFHSKLEVVFNENLSRKNYCKSLSLKDIWRHVAAYRKEEMKYFIKHESWEKK